MRKIISEVKNAFDGFCEILDQLGSNVELNHPSPSGDGNMTLLELFYEDMRDYLLYLSCADGFITNDEAEFLQDYLEYFMTPEQMRSRIISEEIYSAEFEESGQMILRILVDMQNQYNDIGKDIDLFSPLREMYKMMGAKFLECDGEMSNEETMAIVKYIDTVNKYAEENLDSYDEIEEERISKHSGRRDGVAAPRKIM